MKKKIIFIILLLTDLICLIPDRAWSSAADNLKIRLSKIGSFHGTFTQEITDSSGQVIQKGQGDLWVRHPSLFNIHMTQPDENILISNGKTLLFYNPFIEQATITWLKDAINDTPFIMIMRNQISDWQRYTIRQFGNTFELKPKNDNSNLKQFFINIKKDGTIKQCNIVQQDDQRSNYRFISQKKETKIDMSKFTFTLPKNVTIDDQRNDNG